MSVMVAGRCLKTIYIPDGLQTIGPNTVESAQLCVYSDTELLIPTTRRLQAVGQKQRWYTLYLSLYKIECEDRHF